MSEDSRLRGKYMTSTRSINAGIFQHIGPIGPTLDLHWTYIGPMLDVYRMYIGHVRLVLIQIVLQAIKRIERKRAGN